MFKVTDRVYLHAPNNERVTGEVIELYNNEDGIEMAGIAIDSRIFYNQIIYISQALIKKINKEITQ